MPGTGDDRAALAGGYEESPVYTSGMLQRDIQALREGFQLISPKSNEQASGNNIGVGSTAMTILPYDRNRVRGTVKVSKNIPGTTTAQPTGLFIGSKEDVRAGGGFWLDPGDSVAIESVDELSACGVGPAVYVSVLVERQGGDVI